MANELDLYSGGELAPYAPSPTLDTEIQPYDHGEPSRSPASSVHRDDSWGDGLLFGSPMPPGTTPQQVQVILGEIGGLYLADFTKLGYPNHLINSAITFLMNVATKPARQVTPRHGFKLPADLKDDWLANLFGNYLSSLGGTHEQKSQFLSASILWLDKLNKRLGSLQLGESQGKPAKGSAPNADPTANLTDAQFEDVVRINDAARIKTMAYLQQLWGNRTETRLQLVDEFYKTLPLADQRVLDVYTTGWVRALNTKEINLGLYQQALNHYPSGNALEAEIEEHQRMMAGTNRRRWMDDDKMGSRYRQLIRIRDS